MQAKCKYIYLLLSSAKALTKLSLMSTNSAFGLPTYPATDLPSSHPTIQPSNSLTPHQDEFNLAHIKQYPQSEIRLSLFIAPNKTF